MTSERKDKRNTLGGPQRNRNNNPGQGQGQHTTRVAGDHPAPPREAQPVTMAKVFGDAPPEDSAAGRQDFKDWMDHQKRVAILDAMQAQAEKGNVMAARLLLDRDMGVPTATVDLSHKGITTGAELARQVDTLIAAQRARLIAAGIDVTIVDRVIEQAIWDPEPGEHS